MADIILGVGVKFNPADIDVSAIRKAVVGALTSAEIKLAKIKIAPGATKDALDGVQFVLGRNNFRVSNKAINAIHNAIQRGLNQNPFSITINANNLRNQVNQVLQNMGMGGGVGGGLPQLGAKPTAAEAKGGMTAAAMRLRRIRQEIEQQTQQANIFAQPTARELAKLSAGPRRAAGAPPAVMPINTTPAIQAAKAAKILQEANAAATVEQEKMNMLLMHGGLNAEMMGAKIGQITERFGAYLIALKAIFLAQQVFATGIKDIVELDSALQDLQKVLKVTPDELRNITTAMFEVAQGTGKSVSEVAQSVGDFVRQGLNIKQALTEANNALILANISELNVSDATATLTTSMRVFGNELKNSAEAMDILSTVGDASASTATQLAQALIRSGAAAEAVGVSFRELNAIQAAVVETTQLSGDTVGAAFKTIFASMAAVRTQLVQLGNAWGVDIQQSDSQFTVLMKLSEAYKTLDNEQRAQISTLLGGKRRFTELNALLSNFTRVQELLSDSYNSNGAAARKNAIELDKLSVKATQVATSFSQFVNSLSGADEGARGAGLIRGIFSDILVTINSMIQGANSFINTLKDVGVFKFIQSVLFGAVKGGLLVVGPILIKSLVSGFLQFVQLGHAINSMLSAIGGKVKGVSNETTGLVQKEIQLNTQLNRQVGLYSKIWDLTKRISTSRIKNTPTFIGQGGELTNAAEKGAAKLVRGVTIAAGAQVIIDAIGDVASSFKQASDANIKYLGTILNATSNSASFGLAIGLLAGPVAGLTAGLGALLIAVSKTTIEFVANLGRDTGIIKALNEWNIDAAQAAADGGQIAKSFEILKNRLNGGGQETINALTLIAHAWEQEFARSDNLANTIKQINQVYDKLFQEIQGTLRSVDIQNSLKDFTASLRTKGMEFKLQLKTGEVDSAFAPAFNNLAAMQSKLQDIESLNKSGLSTYQQLAQVEKALGELTDKRSKSTQVILTEFGLHTTQYIELIKEQQSVNAQIKEQEDNLAAVNERLKSNRSFTKEIQLANNKTSKLSKETAISQTEGADITRQVKEAINAITKDEEEQKKAQDAINKLKEQSSVISEGIGKQVEREKDLLIDIAKEYKAFIESIRNGIAQTAAENRIQSDKLELIKEQTAAQIKLIELEAQGGNASEVFARKVSAINQSITDKVSERVQKEKSTLAAIQSAREQAAKAGQLDKAKELDALASEARTVLESKKEALTEQLQVEASVEIKKITIDAVKQAEDALRDVRLNAIQQVAEQEANNAQHKIEMIKEFSKTAEGLSFLQKEMGNISNSAERLFGQTGARIVQIQDEAANKAAEAVAAQLSNIPSDISDEAKLKALLEARNKLIEINEKNISEKRAVLLDRVQEAVERVNRAEEHYIAEKNKLPAIYAKELDSLRSLGQAEKAQDDANEELMKAYKAASDANADYAFGLLKSAFDVKQATGSLSTGQAIGQLNNIFNTLVTNSQLSGQKLIEIRSQIAQEELSIMQQQFNAIKSTGLQAATATGDEFNKMIEGMRTAAAIQSGLNPGQFTAEQLAGALNFKDIFSGIENKVAEFGLSRLGIDPSILKNTENQMVTLAKQVAETGKLQVDSANAQVLAAQQQVNVADEARNVTLEQLKQDQLNTAFQQQVVVYAAQNVVALQSGFSHLAIEIGNELTKLGEQTAATQQGNILLAQIDTSIKDVTTSINDLAVKLGASFSASFGAIGAATLGASVATGGVIPGAARGTLSHMEMNSLASAARKEKTLMPHGSRLMMANTSEVVLTRKQAKKIGLKPLIQSNAAAGNAVGDPALANAASTLNNSIQMLMNKLNSPGFVQQTINVQVDTERNVNVRGLDAVNDAMKAAFENKTRESVTKEEHQAISDIVVSLAERLNELGIINSRGV